MDKNVFVFIPKTLKWNKMGYLKGCYRKFEDCEAFYITEDLVSNNYSQSIGYIGRSFKSSKCRIDHCIFINNFHNKITVNNADCDHYSIMDITYDYHSFKNSDIICRECDRYGKHFKLLAEELKKSNTDDIKENGRKSIMSSIVLVIMFVIGVILKITNVVKPVLLYSATFLCFEENVINLRWFLKEIIQKRKLSPKTGNMLVAKIVDLLIGVILLNWCLKYENDILNFIQTIIEDIITNLRGLLLYLMGSPIGLKLNHAFNNTLGKFFFYHISLWRIFLLGMEPLLRAYFKYLVLPGALGFSFQIAMLSDIISIATFHVYCIYVYAARLFSLQIRGLASLWRLFIGRKLNPLRKRVDSCKYTPDQLFIGTLGFTILLFLLPTTTMYYAVFTTNGETSVIKHGPQQNHPENIYHPVDAVKAYELLYKFQFRLGILLANGLLLRARFLLNTLPLYVLVLWILNSSSVAGTVYIDWKNNEEIDRVIVEAKLKALPLKSSIKKFIPDPVNAVEGKSYGYILRNVFTGVLL